MTALCLLLAKDPTLMEELVHAGLEPTQRAMVVGALRRCERAVIEPLESRYRAAAEPLESC